MPFKPTGNWLFNDIWCYLVIGCFDWKISIFQQIVVRVNYIIKGTITIPNTASAGAAANNANKK